MNFDDQISRRINRDKLELFRALAAIASGRAVTVLASTRAGTKVYLAGLRKQARYFSLDIKPGQLTAESNPSRKHVGWPGGITHRFIVGGKLK